jgi:hypothetical protein
MENLKESTLLGSQLLANEDFVPIVREIRQKYNNLPEIRPDDDPITEVCIGDEKIPLEIRFYVQAQTIHKPVMMTPIISLTTNDQPQPMIMARTVFSAGRQSLR